MQTIEFYAKPENGVIIIPEAYRERTHFKVTVVDDEFASINKWDLIFPPSIDTKKWRFDREEANERR